MKNTECIGELWLKILIYTQSESLKEQRNNGPTAILQRFSTRPFKCWGVGGETARTNPGCLMYPKKVKTNKQKDYTRQITLSFFSIKQIKNHRQFSLKSI